MPLLAPKKLYQKAEEGAYALPAFNTSNLEVTQAIVRGLASARAPGIIAVSKTSAEYAGLPVLRDIIRDLIAEVSVPVTFHLDHGKEYAVVERALEAGFPSVMVDGSALSFVENVDFTKRVVEAARKNDVWVEGEIGPILGKEGLTQFAGGKMPASMLTTPEEAKRFVGETGVDALAVAVGTMHGAFSGTEYVDLERLAAIRDAVGIPLVLHGGSGLSAKDLRDAVERGVRKVNIDTDLRIAFDHAVEEAQKDDTLVDPRKILGPARDAMQKVVEEKARIVGAAGQA